MADIRGLKKAFTIERGIYKALQEFQRLQDERQAILEEFRRAFEN